MTDWLIQHGFAYKRPKKIPGKLDPEKQRIFIEQYRALKETLNPDEEIYFIDAVHPNISPKPYVDGSKKAFKRLCRHPGNNCDCILLELFA
nr:winged helix-turn-helix domain-containing protein [Candidatus Rhabdochlamydia oedothoracis]